MAALCRAVPPPNLMPMVCTCTCSTDARGITSTIYLHIVDSAFSVGPQAPPIVAQAGRGPGMRRHTFDVTGRR